MSRSNANVFVTDSEITQAIREVIAARPGGAPGWTFDLQKKAERNLRSRLYRLLEGIANEAQDAVSHTLANDRDRAVADLEGIAADNDVVRSERNRAIAERDAAREELKARQPQDDPNARDWVVNLDPRKCYWIADLNAVLANGQYRGRDGTTEVSGHAYRMTCGSAMHFQRVMKDRYPDAIVERIVPSQP